MDWKRIFHSGEPVKRPAGRGRWVKGNAKCAPGSRNYMLWVPGGYDPAKPSPLLLMLHGCRQKPADLAQISGMNAVADRNNFLVAYPEQTVRANLLRCWDWFETKHQSRGAGEPAILAAVVEQVRWSHNVDALRVYVAGISAGAAMAVIVGATYPDVFAGIGAIAGLEFKAGSGLISGRRAMARGGPNAKQQGVAAFEAMSTGLANSDRRRMPIIVFQGNADSSVHPINADQLIAQWAVTNQLLSGDKNRQPDTAGELVHDRVADGHSYRKYSYKDAAGRLLMEKWIVEGLGHAWPGSPFRASYADPKGPNASEEMWRFFSETTAEPAVSTAGKSVWDRTVGALQGAFNFAGDLLGGKES
jgi:poly(hydroxyalkanoate) depolymerase family esterase